MATQREPETQPIADAFLAGTLPEVLPLGVVYVDSDGRATAANPAAEQILGVTAREMHRPPSVGPRWAAVREDGGFLDSREHPAMLALKSGAPVRDHILGILNPTRQDVTWVKVDAFPVLDDAKSAPLGAYVLVEDITAQRRLARDRERLQRSLTMILDAHQTLMRANDVQTFLQDVCRLAVEAGGYRMAWVGVGLENEKKSVRVIAHAGDDSGYLDHAEISWDGSSLYSQGPTGKAIRTGVTQVNQNSLTNARMEPWRDALMDRGYKSSIALPLLGETRLRGVFTLYAPEPDAFSPQEVKLLETLARDLAFGMDTLRARRLRQAAEAAHLAKSSFLANMSYEIRTPINSMLGLAHLIKRDGVSVQQEERLEKIQFAGKQLLEVVDTVLDLSKMDSGQFQLEEERLSVERVTENVISELLDSAQAKQLELIVQNGPLPRNLIGDSVRLHQLLANYVTNAIKFTEQGTITLRTMQEADLGASVRLRFEVQDTGVGIAPAALPGLFSSFENADRSMSSKPGGRGLGLAVSKRLAHLMGGDVGVISSPGAGSTFWFTVELRKAESGEDVAQSALMEAEAALRQSCGGLRVLLTEDDPLNREVVIGLIEGLGLVVDTAEDGAAAVLMMMEKDYDLILMDLQMPNLDGLEATRQIRRLPNGGSVPIIALTANTFVEDRRRCEEVGMNDFVPKPLDPHRLFTAMRRSLIASA